MINAQQLSIIAAICMVAVLISQRRLLFSWNAIGVFWITNLIFVYIGVLFLPWLHSLFGEGVWFSGIDFSRITDENIQWSIILTIGGGMAVLIFYKFAHILFGKKIVLGATPSLSDQTARPLFHGLRTRRLLIVSIFPLLYAIAYVLLHRSDFISGVNLGMLLGDPELVIAARRETTRNYLYVLLVYNLIPFLGVALWLRFYWEKATLAKFYTYFYNFCAAVLLTLTFQKRPLLIFLIALLAAHLWMHVKVELKSEKRNRFKLGGIIPIRKIIWYGSVLFGILIILYLAQTQIGRSGEELIDTVIMLSGIIVIRIFGRLATEPSMVVHYYPAIEPFYGFKNIGLLSYIFGFKIYQANEALFDYFYPRIHIAGSSVAVPALMDFYGAFGVPGWVAGTMLLGFMLYGIDVFLARRENNACNILLKIFMFVFVYYLSQSSLPRALLGYGGGFFVFLWWLLRNPHAGKQSAADTSFPDSLEVQPAK